MGNWNHDYPGMYGGSAGSYSKYSDGVQSVVFYMGRSRQWEYEANLTNFDHAPGFGMETVRQLVPEQYQISFDNGDIKNMSVLARKIIKKQVDKDPKFL